MLREVLLKSSLSREDADDTRVSDMFCISYNALVLIRSSIILHRFDGCFLERTI